MSTNGTSSWPYEPLDNKQGVILFALAFVGMIANITAFCATLRLPRAFRSSLNIFVLALTSVDLLCLVIAPVPTFLCYLTRNWVGGQHLCRFQGCISIFAAFGSGCLATAMAVDRHVAVCKPFSYRNFLTQRYPFRVVASALLFSGIIAVLPLIGFGNFVRNLTGTYCSLDWFASAPINKAYAIIFAFIGIGLIITVVFANATIAVRVFQRIRMNAVNRTQGNSTEKKLTRTVVLISILFVVCWLPYMIRVICNQAGWWKDPWIDVQVSRLMLINFALDPFLYTLSRAQCRRVVGGWLRPCCSPCARAISKARQSTQRSAITPPASHENSAANTTETSLTQIPN